MPARPSKSAEVVNERLMKDDYEDDYDDEEEIEDEEEEEDDDDDIMMGDARLRDDDGYDDDSNKENALSKAGQGTKRSGKKIAFKNKEELTNSRYIEDEDEDESEDEESVASEQQQQQQEQQMKSEVAQQAEPGKKGGLCSGKSSVEVKDSLKPTEKQDANKAERENKEELAKENKAQKGSGGLCRSKKNVEVERSLKPVEQPTEKPGDLDKNVDESKKNNNKADKPPAKKSGGMCGGRKSVQIEEPEKSEDKGSAELPRKGSRDSEELLEAKPQPTDNQKKLSEGSKKKSGGLCGGKSSVEVKDSLQPAGIPDEQSDSGVQPARALPVKGKPKVEEEQEESDEEELLEAKVTKKKKKKKKVVREEVQREDDEEQDDEEMDEIYLGPDPPPPSLKSVKKKKKKKKAGDTYVKDDPLSMGNRKGKYAVTAEDEEPTPSKRKAAKKPKSGSPSKGTQDTSPESEGIEMTSPTKKKKKKKKIPQDTDPELDVHSVYQSQLAEVEALPLDGETIEFDDTLQPTIEDENELLANAKEERMKNKQRLRERKMREKEYDSPVKEGDGVTRAYSSAQREIDRVLMPREEEEERKKKEKSKEKGKKKKEGKHNEGYEEDGEVKETLTEARDRMHKLLDDAFVLLSQSHSSIGTKSSKSKKDDSGSDSDRKKSKKKSKKDKKSKHDTPPRRDSHEEIAPDEKRHTPVYVNRTHGAYDSSGLVTWSPYRAADECNTLISMPHQQPVHPPSMPHQQKTTTSVFSETLPESVKNSYYTKEPAEPIVISTRNLDHAHIPPPPYDNLEPSRPLPSEGNGHANGASKGTFKNSLYHGGALPYTTMDRYSEPYHGMSSFQDIPQRDTDEIHPMSGRSGASPRDQDGGVIMVREHHPPQTKEHPNHDVIDVISDSMRPGTSPKPLIDSLREELQSLSNRRAAEGDGRHSKTLAETAAGMPRSNGAARKQAWDTGDAYQQDS